MSWFKKDPLQIITFKSYGTASLVHVRGRALEDEIIDLSHSSYFNLLLNSYKRFESDEIKRADLVLKLPNASSINVTTDSHGYYRIDQSVENLKAFADTEGWLQYTISYTNNLQRSIQNNNAFTGEFLIPSERAKFGIISDIDDTILHTGVVSSFKWQVIYNTIFRPASKRIPLEGAAEFYQQLHKGASGNEANPIFYVSHSPWNLYRYLEYFLKENNFPKGPILLRSFKTILKRKTKGDIPQKHKEILDILKTYPHLKIILIGDSGERDPDIYLEVAEQYPDRILAIYLRSVNHKVKIRRVQALLDQHKTTPSLLVKSSEEAIAHARAHGFLK